MNTSINQLVYELLELRRAYLKNTDSLDKRLVIDWVQSQRSRLLKQKFDKPFSSIDDHYVQSLGSLTMQKVVSNDITPVVDDYDYLYLTTLDIPRTIEQPEGKGTFTRIGPANKLSPGFTITTYEKALSYGNGKFNRNSIYAFVLGDKIGLYSKSGIHFGVKYLDVRGVFQDAITAARIKTPTWDYNDDYPINKEIIDQLKVLIINEKFGLTLVQAEDKTDNKEEDAEGPINVQKRAPQSNSGLQV